MSDLTIGQLRRALAIYSDDDILHLPGDLTFYRIKAWGNSEAILEVAEPLANLAPAFKKRNPNLKCAFIALPELEDSAVVSDPV